MSPSIMPTLLPHLASASARFTASVVLPTPPLPAPTAITFFTPGTGCRGPSAPAASRTRALVCTSTGQPPRHGIVLMAAELVLFLALGIVTGLLTLVTFGFGLALSVLLYILSWTTILVVHIVAIIKALGGSRLDIPRISVYASRF